MNPCSTVFQRRKIQGYIKSERCLNSGNYTLPLVVTSLFMASILAVFLLYSPNPLFLTSTQKQQNEEQKSCDLFKGQWVKASRGSYYYTNSSCPTIPDSKNCLKQGRQDMDFLNWKWKPEKCELARFDPKAFLNIVRGKKMAFIGDSLARNHMESLLCLLSQEETPKDIYKDPEDRCRKWYFQDHNFTLMSLWSRFLISGQERIVNGTGSSSFDMHLDKLDEDWVREFPDLDYAIISNGHWFFRVMYLHEASKLVGCVYCHHPNLTHYYNVDFPIRMAFRATFKYINTCNNCKRNVLTLLRTFAPSHFENGAWNTGGYCNRTSPMSEEEVDHGGVEWEVRKVQMEEIERARKDGKKKKNGMRFEVVDVTRAMMMRADGHPGEFWGNKWMRGYSDCTHWCMPGPIDLWNQLLLALLTN